MAGGRSFLDSSDWELVEGERDRPRGLLDHLLTVASGPSLASLPGQQLGTIVCRDYYDELVGPWVRRLLASSIVLGSRSYVYLGL
jgi:hypothetical protein